MDSTSDQRPDDPANALQVYRYIGTSAEPVSEGVAMGKLTWRPDLEVDGQPSMAALAVFVQAMSGVVVVPYTPVVVPTSVTVHRRGTTEGVAALEGRCEIVRAGRTTAITSAMITDADDPERTVAHALATWAFPGGHVDPRGEARPTSTAPYVGTHVGSLVEWLSPVEHPEGLAVNEVRPEIAEPIALGGTASRSLHGGPLQILNEASARRHVRQSTGSHDAQLLDFATHFLTPARGAPLVARATTIARFGDDLDVRVELLGDGKLYSFSEGRFRVP